MFIEGGDEVERDLKKCVSRGPAEEDELSSNKCNFGIAPACLLSSRSLFRLSLISCMFPQMFEI